MNHAKKTNKYSKYIKIKDLIQDKYNHSINSSFRYEDKVFEISSLQNDNASDDSQSEQHIIENKKNNNYFKIELFDLNLSSDNNAKDYYYFLEWMGICENDSLLLFNSKRDLCITHSADSKSAGFILKNAVIKDLIISSKDTNTRMNLEIIFLFENVIQASLISQ